MTVQSVIRTERGALGWVSSVDVTGLGYKERAWALFDVDRLTRPRASLEDAREAVRNVARTWVERFSIEVVHEVTQPDGLTEQRVYDLHHLR